MTTAKQDDWLPIGTAPEDSTVIDIWRPGDGRLTEYFRVALSEKNVFYAPRHRGPCVVRDATHWRPIPKDPT